MNVDLAAEDIDLALVATDGLSSSQSGLEASALELARRISEEPADRFLRDALAQCATLGGANAPEDDLTVAGMAFNSWN